MAQAQPMQRDHGIGISEWHSRLLASLTKDANVHQGNAHPSRSWEQLAGDLFLVNMDSPLWGWSDPNSTWLLDFWLNFEAKLYFILVCISPQRALGNLIVDTRTGQDIASTMDAWFAHHEAMLRFHLRNPKRSLLVDADDCLAHSEVLISTCAERWDLPLLYKAASSEIDVSGIDSLALYLANQMCVIQPQLSSLQHELDAARFYLGPSKPQAGALHIVSAEVIAAYRQRGDRDELAKQREALQEQLTQAHQELATQEKLATDRQAQVEQLARDRDELAKQREVLQEQLTQAHQELTTQEKLATDRQAQLVQNNAEITRQFASHSEQLLIELRNMQLESEGHYNAYLNNLRQFQTADERWKRILRRNPLSCDFESIHALPLENDDAGIFATKWKLLNFFIADRRFPLLEFETMVKHGVAGFVFRRDANDVSPLKRWPASAQYTPELVLIPVSDAISAPLSGTHLLDLATGDWDLLQSLCLVLQEALGTPDVLDLPSNYPREVVRNAVGSFTRKIAAFPSVLRYDRVSLKREQVNPDYEHLWLGLDHLTFSDQRWAQFEFRLSCALPGSVRFGAYPKLEFPEKFGRVPFENWFEDSRDDFGPKLELRFAQPVSMDMEIWQRLSHNDQCFLAALIERLPAMLATVHQTGVQLHRPWRDWINMLDHIQRIHTLSTALSGLRPSGIRDTAMNNPM